MLYSSSQKKFIKKQYSYRHLNQCFHALKFNKLCKRLWFVYKHHSKDEIMGCPCVYHEIDPLEKKIEPPSYPLVGLQQKGCFLNR